MVRLPWLLGAVVFWACSSKTTTPPGESTGGASTGGSQSTGGGGFAGLGGFAGYCGYRGSGINFQNCDFDPGNGCETNVETDLAHCGSCTKSCVTNPPNANVHCTQGKCGISCAAGFKDCNMDCADGCECGGSGGAYAIACDL